MTVSKSPFLSYILAKKLFWYKRNELMPTLLYRIYNCLFYILTIGNLNYLLTSYYARVKFADIVLNLSWLITLVFCHYLVIEFRSIAKPANVLWDKQVSCRFVYCHDEQVKTVRIVNLALKYVLGLVVVTLLAGVCLFETEPCGDRVEENACGIMYPSHLFVNLSARPYRELYNMSLFFVCLYVFTVILLAANTLYCMVLYIRIALMEFKCILKKACETPHKQLRYHQLIKAHKLQHCFKRSWDEFAHLFKWTLFAQYLVTGITAALILISELNEFHFILLGMFGVYVFGTLVLGYLAEEMQKLSDGFRDATFYAVPWDGDVKSAKFLMFMNLNSNDLFKLYLGDYAIYSNERVFMILKMIYTIVMFYLDITK